MSAKVKHWGSRGTHHVVLCPGCHFEHVFDERWTFNGDDEKPTFRASMLIHENEQAGHKRCHSIVTLGRIQFLSDTQHGLRGQTVELPNVEDWETVRAGG